MSYWAWSVEDSNSIKDTLNKTIESIKKPNSDMNHLIHLFGLYCYYLGVSRGYDNGHKDAKNGEDERISNIKVN